jgi:DNA-binding beta-propeller fold protein YncE
MLALLCRATAFAVFGAAFATMLVFVDRPNARAAGFDASIRTLAGNGELGYRDGDAKTATFILPVGIAAGPHDTVYVADAGSQRIRIVRDGTVRTLAGGGSLAPLSFWVQGGYRDAKGNDARFNFPAALAVTAAGGAYVADADNHCVRFIEPDGTVSTFAGAPTEAIEKNGPRSAARFHRPTGIALDPSGNLYVADQQVGLRKIDTSGTVTTQVADAGITGVAISPDGRSVLVLDVTGGMSLILDGHTNVMPSSDQLFGSRDVLHPSNLTDVGHPFAATMIDPYRAIYSDAKNGGIRYIDFLTYTSKVLVGDRQMDGTNDESSFADAPLEQGRVSNPLGVVLGKNGRLYVADSTNRRIRVVEPLNFRQATIASVSAFPPEISHDGSKNVVIVGSSFVWAGCVWDDSWEGLLEKRLRAAGIRVTFYPIQMNGAKQDADLDYITGVLPDLPNVGRVLFFVNGGLIGTNAPNWQPDYVAKLRAARDALAKRNIAFFVAVVPGPYDADWQELPLRRYLYDPIERTPGVGAFYSDIVARTKESGVDYVDLLPYFLQTRRSDTRPLYGTSEDHMSDHGRAVTADSLYETLRRQL